MAFARVMAKRKIKEGKLCDVCSQRFVTFEAAEEHRRRMHPDVTV